MPNWPSSVVLAEWDWARRDQGVLRYVCVRVVAKAVLSLHLWSIYFLIGLSYCSSLSISTAVGALASLASPPASPASRLAAGAKLSRTASTASSPIGSAGSGISILLHEWIRRIVRSFLAASSCGARWIS